MIDQVLVDELAAARYLPSPAIARAAATPSLVALPVLEALESAANGVALTGSQENLLFWGIHILGAARDERAFSPLMRFLRLPDEKLEVLLGDAVTVTLPRIVVGVFDGSASLLQEMIADRGIDQFLRNSLLSALTFLTWDGRIDQADTAAFFERFDDDRLADPEDFAWDGWQQSIALLGFRSLVPRVEAAWRDGRISGVVTDKKWFYRALKAAENRPRDRERFAAENLGYIEDIVAELAWLPSSSTQDDHKVTSAPSPAGFRPIPPVINPLRHVGRNDPCPCGSGKKAKRCCLAA